MRPPDTIAGTSMITRTGILLAVFLAVMGTAAAAGLSPILLTRESGSTPVHTSMEFLEDRGGAMGLPDAEAASGWRRFTGRVPNFGLTSSAYWVRFAVRDDSGTGGHVLELGFPSMDSVKLFLPGEPVRETGDRLPFDRREVPQRTFLFRLPEGISGTVYLRVQTSGTMLVPLTPWSPAAFLGRMYSQQLLFGLFWGIMAGLFFYNLFLLVSLRDSGFIWYLAFVLSFFLFQFSEDGFAFQYIWPRSPFLANAASPLFLAATLGAILAFTRSFLATSGNTPVMNGLLITGMGLSCLFAVSVFVLDHRAVIMTGTVMVILTALLVAAAAAHGMLRRFRPARWFAAAWVVLLVTSALADSEVSGLIGDYAASLYLVKAGAALELVLLSLALADRINAMKVERALLQELATVDEKTRVANFRALESALVQEIRRSLRYRRPVSLIMVDVDDFKRINDEHGHKAGDEVLRSTARALRENCRDVDVVARFGGDEFAVVLPETPLSRGIETAAKLRAIVAETPVRHNGVDIRVTISLGVASVPSHARDRNGLVEAADKALYLAKETGKDRVRFIESGEADPGRARGSG
jgi:two-component system, sensor histidine kinase LadS